MLAAYLWVFEQELEKRTPFCRYMHMHLHTGHHVHCCTATNIMQLSAYGEGGGGSNVTELNRFFLALVLNSVPAPEKFLTFLKILRLINTLVLVVRSKILYYHFPPNKLNVHLVTQV